MPVPPSNPVLFKASFEIDAGSGLLRLYFGVELKALIGLLRARQVLLRRRHHFCGVRVASGAATDGPLGFSVGVAPEKPCNKLYYYHFEHIPATALQ